MTTYAPFWSLATLISDSAEAGAFQVSLEDIISESGRLINGELAHYDSKGTPFVAGDVLFGKLRPYLAKYWHADRAGTAGGDIHVYRPADEIDSRYLSYVVGSRDFVKFAEAASKGVKMPRAEWMGLRELSTYRPELDTQKRIADYLDRETGEIDAMLAKMDELTETLEARRTAVIDRELSPHLLAPLESGWTVTDCMHKTATFVDEGENFIVSIGQLDGAYIDTTNSPRTTEAEFAYLRSGGRAPKPGDAVMSRNASVGKLALVAPQTPAFALGQDVVLLSPFGDEDARLLAYAMGATRTREALDLMMQGTTFKRINVASIRKLPWVHLSGDEQARIADHLDEVTRKIDQMLAKTAELKSLLIERRSALITDVVTGKKQVHS